MKQEVEAALRDAIKNDLKYGLEVGRRSSASCKPLARIFREGRGGLRTTDLHIRTDGIEYNVEGDWVKDLVRLAVWVEMAFNEPDRFLAERARIKAEVEEVMSRQSHNQSETGAVVNFRGST